MEQLHGSLRDESNNNIGSAGADDFQLRDDFFKDKCDPCLPRNDYSIKVLVHGVSNDVHWQQVQSTMQQASRDTGVSLSMNLYDPKLSMEEIYADMALQIRTVVARVNDDNKNNLNQSKLPDAFIVTLPPSPAMYQAVNLALNNGVPIFGFQHGYTAASNEQVGTLGFVAQDEQRAGRLVAQHLIEMIQEKDAIQEQMLNNGTNTSLFTNRRKRILFVNHDRLDQEQTARYKGLQSTILSETGGMVAVTQVYVDRNDVFNSVQILQEEAFTNCPYDYVVLGGTDYVDVAVSALEELQCQSAASATELSVFGMTEQVLEMIVQRQIALAAAPQDYIEAAFAVVMASMFVTTGKKLALPKGTDDDDNSNIYVSGPVLITKDNIPTDSIKTCRQEAFPVCNSDGRPHADDKATTTSADGVAGTCNANIGCLPRDVIRIGGVLHGVNSDLFWDPVFAAARQAAVDLNVELELERFDPEASAAVLHAKMAARIQYLCESGVDGLFVTIPDDTLLESIMLCQSLNIPVIAINAGVSQAEELGLAHFIGPHEYNAGYGAGKRLISRGMKEGYCLSHIEGLGSLKERCRGFADAIAEDDKVVYKGIVIVEDDNKAEFALAVETAVNEGSPTAGSNWDNIGLLVLGGGQVASAMVLKVSHPGSLLGAFDLTKAMFAPFANDQLLFGIDQQPFLQGSLPVYLLTYSVYTQQFIVNDLIETGPRFVEKEPSDDEKQCEASFFAICSSIPEEDMHFISDGILLVGYFFASLTILVCLGCIVWVVYYAKKSQLVRVSQPPFLIALCCGCIVSVLSIFPMGIQTGNRTSKDELTGFLTTETNGDIGKVDAACMMVPWFYSLGFAMIFSSLFGKIWRVQMIFKAGQQFRRQNVTFGDVAPKVGIIFSVITGLLVAWQLVAPLKWQREIVDTDSDGFSLESIGSCTSDDGWWFWLAIMLFQVFCLFYALVLCFQTRHIQDELSESSVLFLSVICIFQIDVLVMPISAMVRDDPVVFYFVRASAVFLQNISVLGLMFAPKIWKTYTKTDDLPLLRAQMVSSIRRSSRHVSFDFGSQNSNLNLSNDADPTPPPLKPALRGSGQSSSRDVDADELLIPIEDGLQSSAKAEDDKKLTPREGATEPSTTEPGEFISKDVDGREILESLESRGDNEKITSTRKRIQCVFEDQLSPSKDVAFEQFNRGTSSTSDDPSREATNDDAIDSMDQEAAAATAFDKQPQDGSTSTTASMNESDFPPDDQH